MTDLWKRRAAAVGRTEPFASDAARPTAPERLEPTPCALGQRRVSERSGRPVPLLRGGRSASAVSHPPPEVQPQYDGYLPLDRQGVASDSFATLERG